MKLNILNKIFQKKEKEKKKEWENKFMTIVKENNFVRPDPGPAGPGSDDNGVSYERVFTTMRDGQRKVTKQLLFQLGCITSKNYDGSSDSVYIDVITGEPLYVVTRQNGGICDFFLYGGRPITFGLVRELAKAGNFEKYYDIDESNWHEKISE